MLPLKGRAPAKKAGQGDMCPAQGFLGSGHEAGGDIVQDLWAPLCGGWQPNYDAKAWLRQQNMNVDATAINIAGSLNLV